MHRRAEDLSASVDELVLPLLLAPFEAELVREGPELVLEQEAVAVFVEEVEDGNLQGGACQALSHARHGAVIELGATDLLKNRLLPVLKLLCHVGLRHADIWPESRPHDLGDEQRGVVDLVGALGEFLRNLNLGAHLGGELLAACTDCFLHVHPDHVHDQIFLIQLHWRGDPRHIVLVFRPSSQQGDLAHRIFQLGNVVTRS
mmetsp:Transcript_70344/g.201561  ORF Transcript_70344/g.201561 Transcript_70344/m.201561 type:complete len:202 (-) Transcript_70344:855-1460(-)